MTLKIVLPFGNEDNVKNIVFSILMKEYPLKLIELTNFIRKRYGRDVTFQAVRKAVLQLLDEEVLIKKDNEFLINKKWVKEIKQKIDDIYQEINKEKPLAKSVDSIEGDVSVFTFNSLNDLMRFWQDLIDDWFDNFKKGDYNINVYQAAHAWEGLLHPDIEKVLMHQLGKKGIKAYILTTGNTLLDRQIMKFYSKIGVKTIIDPSSSSFDKTYYIGTYGDMIIQAKYPKKIVKKLDNFFKKSKTLKDLNLIELSNIVNMKIEIKLTVIKNIEMAKKINEAVLART